MMNHTLDTLIQKIDQVIDRLDVWLPPVIDEPDWSAIAYRWERIGHKGILHALPNPHTFPLSRLAGIDEQMSKLVDNTLQFLSSLPANNVLLSGARGTGKSSLIKALLHEYANQGLRLIEVDKSDLLSLPYLLSILVQRPEKFIIFCDDLSFEAGEDGYKALKTILDGGLSVRCNNVLVYATSNRRHLMPEYQADNADSEIHPKEAIEEKISLSDRFGLWLSFYAFDQETYLKAVASWIEDAGLIFNESIRTQALSWSLSRGSRSGRVAWQFVCDYVGKQRLKK